ncbi:DUF1848 domain-containing protein [candidate division WOR-3 bacterium]|nr:DUF1848 domain-containing protein [candidate division WOR-3 bacterium]
MIISASRRTDIPAFHGDWLFNRIREGFINVKNPRNSKQFRHVSLSYDSVDGIVFWTKNPRRFISHLEELKNYNYYFQFTLNSYGKEIEPGVPPYSLRIDDFKRLSDKIGPEKNVLRIDPVIITEKYTVGWHIESFEKTVFLLQNYTERIVFSFVDIYRKNAQKLDSVGAVEIGEDQMSQIALNFGNICKIAGLEVFTCAESMDLSSFGVRKGKCVDARLLERISGKTISSKKDRSQREQCLCDESVDIGAYSTCPAGCIYCYANQNVSGVSEIGYKDPTKDFL